MKNEDRLIMQLTRVALDLPAYQSSKSADAESIDWEYLINALQHHGLFLLIYPLLADDQYIVVSDEYKPILKELAHRLTIKSLKMSAELIRICDLLTSHNIPVIPFKGPTLSQEVYGKVGLRIFGDLDILVRDCDVEHVLKILIEREYKSLIELDSDQLQKYIVFEDDIQLSHPNGTIVEVHWEATGRYAKVSADYSYYEPKIIYSNFHGKKIQQFGHEDLFIYLCLHGTRHLWERLEWLFSVAFLIKNSTVIDYTYVLLRAKKMGCQKIILQAILMAKEIFDVDIPLIIHEKIKNERRLSNLVRCNKMKLLPLYSADVFSRNGYRFKLFILSLRDSWTDTIKYVLQQIFRLRVADVQFVRLPSSMFMLYYVVRPCRLVLKGLGLI